MVQMTRRNIDIVKNRIEHVIKYLLTSENIEAVIAKRELEKALELFP